MTVHLLLPAGRGPRECAWAPARLLRRLEADAGRHDLRTGRLETVPGADDGTRVYHVRGELFFASSNDLVSQFDYAGDPAHVVIDMSATHIWDASSVAALDAVTTKYASRGKRADIVGLNEASARFHDNLAGRLTPGPGPRGGCTVWAGRARAGAPAAAPHPDRPSCT